MGVVKLEFWNASNHSHPLMGIINLSLNKC